MGYKDQGKNHFERQEYAQALASYRAALSPEFTTSPPRDEKQIILSNIVACRLKIGGAAMASAAIEEAKQVSLCTVSCVSLSLSLSVDANIILVLDMFWLCRFLTQTTD